MTFILLIVGFILLIVGANYFVDASSSIARIFKIPSMIIGLTIVAFGTSSPELAVNISAILKGSTNIAIGNVVGSNIVNILLILGITAIIKPVNLSTNTLKKEFPFLLISTLALYILALDIFKSGPISELSRFDGVILLILFCIFFYYLITSTISSNQSSENAKEEPIKKASLPKSIIISILGLAGIIFGGDLVVNQSVIIARNFGISERIIGLTIVAIGTSLPELVTSVIAATKNESEIAIGNILGSNIFNILFILGVSASIRVLPVDNVNYLDIIVLVFATIITYILSITKKKVSRYEGTFLSIFYIAYIAYILIQP